MNNETNKPLFWKLKLLAYVHDNPAKMLDIRDHEKIAETIQSRAELDPITRQNFDKTCDCLAAAADRFPFPRNKAGETIKKDDILEFIHPLGGGTYRSDQPLTNLNISKVEQDSQPGMPTRFSNETEKHRAHYFLHWRMWQMHMREMEPSTSFFPADTRIKNHSIWNHMDLTSAFQGCMKLGESTYKTAYNQEGYPEVNAKIEQNFQPAFLKVQIGPVQDFIAAARSTRDLWSGSYLLSWLMAAGLKALTAEIGPDAVIYPNLLAQPLFDLHWKKDIWDKAGYEKAKTCWESMEYEAKELATPSLPNLLLAIIPADRGKELGELVTQAIQDEWKNIADSVWDYINTGERCLTDDEGYITQEKREERFYKQVKQFLSIDYQHTVFPSSLKEALKLADDTMMDDKMPQKQAKDRIQKVIEMATKHMPMVDRDSRYYTDSSTKIKLSNRGIAWSLILAHNGWQLDATRHTRKFSAWNTGGWEIGTSSQKDSLTGKEEAVAGGREWRECIRDSDTIKKRFPNHDWLGASTLIKRLWDLAYLKQEKWLEELPSFANTEDIAAGNIEDGKKNNSVDDKEKNIEETSSYLAILALDGDQIGKWMSGENMPKWGDQFSQKAKEYFETMGEQGKTFLQEQMPLTPSFHKLFSEALSNFALYCARPIVEHFKGQLIYAGGDDVLAMLPANQAIPCAQALRDAFQGTLAEEINGVKAHDAQNGGFMTSERKKTKTSKEYPENEQLIPFLVPGTKMDVSVGIAIGHTSSALQDLVRCAQIAEKRAKNTLGRAALALTLMKRSGEITEWGCKWNSQGLALQDALKEEIVNNKLSNKFPNRVAELLTPYLSSPTKISTMQNVLTPEETKDIIKCEFFFALKRQSNEMKKDKAKEIKTLLGEYISSLIKQEEQETQPHSSDKIMNAILGLCSSLSFINRQ